METLVMEIIMVMVIAVNHVVAIQRKTKKIILVVAAKINVVVEEIITQIVAVVRETTIMDSVPVLGGYSY